jgi:hypothetical protein
MEKSAFAFTNFPDKPDDKICISSAEKTNNLRGVPPELVAAKLQREKENGNG